MSTFILVPGAWLGAWAWQPVARSLRGAAHEVYPVSLTGLADRVHLAGPEVNLETHIADIVNLIVYEDLRDVVLVGHSYAGIVVTGVSDRIPARIANVVYVDSGPAPDGASMLDQQPPEVREQTEAAVAKRGDGWRLPMPPWEQMQASLDGLDERKRARMRSHATDQPFGTYTQPLQLTNPDRAALKKTLITCSFPLEQVRQMIAGGHPWFKDMAGPEWTFIELPTGHWPMISEPRRLGALLNQVAAMRAPATATARARQP